MELGLEDLVDGKRIVQIDADSLPSVPHEAPQGNYLFVNCHYAIEICGQMLRTELFKAAQADALEITRRLTAYRAIHSFLSVNVRVIGHFPHHQMRRPAIRRIYAVCIDTDHLPRSATSITPEMLPGMKALEDSQLDDAPGVLEASMR